MRDLLHVLKAMLVISTYIFVLSVCQILEDRRLDRAELYAMRAARNYELVRLVQKTRELNAAALAIIWQELDNPCVARIENRKSKIENGFRRSTPLPRISPIDHSKRARRQSD